jgi:glutathione S-transferase
MDRRPITLYALAISPFVQKVATILDYKKLPYRPLFIHPQRKTEIKFSTKKLVPIIDDGGTIVEDSTDIALYLEEHYPTPPALPADPVARKAVLAIEDWIDTSFIPDFYVANNFGRPANRKRVVGALAGTAPFNAIERVVLPLASGFILRKLIAEATSKVPQAPRALDGLEERLGAGPFLGGQPAVSVADLAAYAVTSFIVDNRMEGADAVASRPKLVAWMGRVRPLTSDGRRMLPAGVAV